MSRPTLKYKAKRDATLEKTIESGIKTAYPPPTSVAVMMKLNGMSISRQAVRNYYRMIGVRVDNATGLWVKVERKADE